MNYIKDFENLNKKKVLLRLDLNVPLKNRVVTDETRINKIIPMIKFLLKKNSKILIISHIGRPKGKVIQELSLEPVCKNLEKKINKKIKLVSKNIFELNSDDLFKDTNDQIIFLENIRFYEGEEKNDLDFSKKLAGLADLFVNDAFSCSHRKHASVSNVTKFLPSFAGLQLETEIKALNRVTTEIIKPVTCIIGGSKISTKIGIIKNLIPKFNNIIIVGGMANNILKYKGYYIGKSVKEDNCKSIIEDIFNTSKKHKCSIVYPLDVMVGKTMNGKSQIKKIDQVEDDDLILDIGPETIDKIKKIIKNSKTVLWNGPAGYFENPDFAHGSFEIAKEIVKRNKENSIYSIAGGGDTIAVLNQINVINNFDFISTAGGAFLEYLEGKELPGIKALN